MRQWAERRRMRTATRTEVRSSLGGMGGSFPLACRSKGSAREGKAANQDRNLWANITESLVMSNENVASGLTTPWNRRERSRPPILVEDWLMIRCDSLENIPDSSTTKGFRGRQKRCLFGKVDWSRRWLTLGRWWRRCRLREIRLFR